MHNILHPSRPKTMDEFDKVLKDARIKSRRGVESSGEFNRYIYFRVGGNGYRIEWYTNISYLTINDEIIVIFRTMEWARTWPVDSCMKLQFRDNTGEMVAVIQLR